MTRCKAKKIFRLSIKYTTDIFSVINKGFEQYLQNSLFFSYAPTLQIWWYAYLSIKHRLLFSVFRVKNVCYLSDHLDTKKSVADGPNIFFSYACK